MKALVKKLIPYSIVITLRQLKQSLESLYFIGNKYECPFCKGYYRKFLPGGENLPFFENKIIIGGGRRDNMLCPRCHSTDRDRLIHYYLTTNQLICQQHYALLHIAPEPSLRKYLKKKANLTYISGDKFEKGYNGFYYNPDTISLDLTALPFQDRCFDIIICNHVLEHIVDETKALQEVHRVLKPGGWAILQVPIDSELKETTENKLYSDEERVIYYGQKDHVRLYGLDYPSRLETHGFKVTKWGVGNQSDQKKISRLALNVLETVYIASK
jgi:SAM-dependent methyltransferase